MLDSFKIDYEYEDKGTNKALILTHGLGGSKKSTTAKALAKNSSISTLRMSMWGHGNTHGDTENITVSKAIESVQVMITFLKNQGYKEIYYYGSSFGGLVGYYIARQNQIKKAFLKCPLASSKELISEEQAKLWKKQGILPISGINLRYTYFEDAKKHEAYTIAPHINTPIYIVHGDEDKTVPLKQSKKMLGLLPQAKLDIINGADHRFSEDKHYEEMIQKLTVQVKQL